MDEKERGRREGGGRVRKRTKLYCITHFPECGTRSLVTDLSWLLEKAYPFGMNLERSQRKDPMEEVVGESIEKIALRTLGA